MVVTRWLTVLLGFSSLSLCVSQVFDQRGCPHCATEEHYQEFFRPQPSLESGAYSDVHMLWSTHIEIVSLTEDFGGWEPPSFHQNLAAEAIAGWKRFRDEIGPGLPNGHQLKSFLNQNHAGALNDGFFHFQKRLFEAEGNLEVALDPNMNMPPTPPPDANCSWPELNAQPEFRRLRKYIEYFSKRYLKRSGMSDQQVQDLDFSLFNWCAVHGAGEFHGPHTHVGEYMVGVFYAGIGPGGGKLRFGDPRGQSPPFGKHWYYTPKPGDLVLFPSWLSHMATVTAASSNILNKSEEEPYRVVFPFNVGPVHGPMPCPLWWSDPTAEMSFHRRAEVSPDTKIVDDGSPEATSWFR